MTTDDMNKALYRIFPKNLFALRLILVACFCIWAYIGYLMYSLDTQYDNTCPWQPVICAQ